MNNEFFKYATKHVGLNTLGLEQYISKINNSGYISPTVIEERQLNVAQMDVFSRLMMDRIIFLGTAIDDYVANIIQAQLLFLESTDSKRDIQIYLNSPGGKNSFHILMDNTKMHLSLYSKTAENTIAPT